MKNITGAIVSGTDFFVRENELNKIWGNIDNNISLIISAPRRMGKTSLLKYLQESGNKKIKFIYIDGAPYDTILPFYNEILSKLSIQKLGQINIENYWKILENGFQELSERIVILVDEFDYLLENINRKKDNNDKNIIDFLADLRILRNQFINVTWIFAVEEASNLLKFSPSLVNDIKYIELQPLLFDEAKLFLKILIQGYNLIIEDNLINYILNQVDWYTPFIIQLFFAKLWKNKEKQMLSNVTKSEIDECIAMLFKENNVLANLTRIEKYIPINSKFARKLYFQHHYNFDETADKFLPQNYPLSYALKTLQVSNFQGINNVYITSIPVDSQWVFLIGENSYGKTTVLQTIALGLFGIIEESNDSEYWQVDSQIGIEFLNDSQNEIKFVGVLDYSFPHLTCYGPSRLQIQTDQTQNDIAKKSTTTYSLFNSDGILLNIEFELLIWFLEKSPKFEAVKKIFLQLIPYLADIEVDVPSRKIYYIEKEPAENGETYKRVSFAQLASGFRSIIAMVGDMMIRLFKSQPTITNPSELAGIVIIDELDLHWHPKMQREIPQLLSKIFPKIQFIASTHSLVPLLGAPKNAVLLKVNRTKEEGITVEKVDIDFQALSSDTLLRDIFDLEKYMSDTKTKAWERYTKLKSLIHFEKDEVKKQGFMEERERLGDKYNFGV